MGGVVSISFLAAPPALLAILGGTQLVGSDVKSEDVSCHTELVQYGLLKPWKRGRGHA